MTKTTLLLFICVTFLASCVSTSSGVPATFVDPIQFKSLNCEELISGKAKRQSALAELSKKQDNARSRAIAFNLLLIVGSGALVKDRADQIGIVKGEIAALESNIATRCGGS